MLQVGTRLTCLAAALVLVGSWVALGRYCDAYRSETRTQPPPYATPAEQVCWHVSGGAMAAAFYLGLAALAVAALLAADHGSDGRLRAISARVLTFGGVLVALVMLTLILVTLYFYNHLDPNDPLAPR